VKFREDSAVWKNVLVSVGRSFKNAFLNKDTKSLEEGGIFMFEEEITEVPISEGM
jgi:hypothetical protein